MVPTKTPPNVASRLEVQVVLRERMSTSPDCRRVKRFCVLLGTNSTLLASPRIAAASALQYSASMPVQLPLLSGAEKPCRPELTAQRIAPRDLMLSRIGPADAACGASAPADRPTAVARLRTSRLRMLLPMSFR